MIQNYPPHNDRIMFIKLRTDENDLLIIKTYMSTSGYKDEEVQEVYEQLEEVMENVRKNDNLIILGDWNAVVVKGQEGDAVGKYGLGVISNRGQRLTDFRNERELTITNTIFNNNRESPYTWVKPDGTARYQIDYIMAKKNIKYKYNQVQRTRELI